jgi:hypothetical protein
VKNIMRDFEELIAALAEGTLDETAAREAEATLARHPDALAALADHRRALAAIREARDVSMSLTERQSVRATVAKAVGIGTTDTATVARPSRRSLWPALAGSAAVLVAMLAIVPMLGDLSRGGSGDAAFELTTRTGESEADDAGTLDLDESDPVLSFGGDLEADNQPLFADGQQSARSTVVESFPATDATEPPSPTTTQPATVQSTATTTTVAKSTEMGDLALLDELDEEMQSATNRFDSALLADDETACLETAVELLPPDTDDRVFVFAYERDGKPTVLVFFGVDDEGVVDRIAVLDPDGCEPLAARG